MATVKKAVRKKKATITPDVPEQGIDPQWIASRDAKARVVTQAAGRLETLLAQEKTLTGPQLEEVKALGGLVFNYM